MYTIYKKNVQKISGLIRSEIIWRFVSVGVTAALFNLFLVFMLVGLLGFNSYILKNASNFIAMLVSMTFAFFLNRRWTWGHITNKTGFALFIQYMLYNSLTLIALGCRTLLFALLEYLGIFYLLNVTLGIGIAAIINFIMYDKHVFREEHLSDKF